MSIEQQPTQPSATGAEWGTPQPKRRPPVKKLVVAAVVALGIAGAGTAVVYAANDSTSSSSDQGPGGKGGMPGGSVPSGGALSDALHGEYVVSDGDGGYATELMQNGEVTAVSDTSITAESEDGYTRTYTIDADTVIGDGSVDLSTIETGDDVMVVATVDGDTATAESLVEAGTMSGPMGQTPSDESTGEGS